MSYSDLRARLRVERRRKGLSQADLAARSGASRVTIARMEADSGGDVRAGTLVRLCEALDLSLAVLPAPEPLLERQLAREREQSRRLRRRLAHARLAARLLSAKRHEGALLVRRALAVVDRWERDGLCSRHYISRWRALLSAPPERVARSLLDPGDWADALFQNTPFSFALERAALEP